MKILKFNKFFENRNWYQNHLKELERIYHLGGLIYRIIYSPNEITNFSNIGRGNYWTYDKDMIFKQINLSMAQSFEDQYTLDNDESLEEFWGYLITAKIEKNSFDIEFSKEKSLEMELEVYVEDQNFDKISVQKVERYLIRTNDYSLNKDKNYKSINIFQNL
jgi:hypothetical protein